MQQFTSEMLIRDVLIARPDTVEIFERHGLACASCLASGMETVSAVATMHGVSIAALLLELNALPTSPAKEE